MVIASNIYMCIFFFKERNDILNKEEQHLKRAESRLKTFIWFFCWNNKALPQKVESKKMGGTIQETSKSEPEENCKLLRVRILNSNQNPYPKTNRNQLHEVIYRAFTT